MIASPRHQPRYGANHHLVDYILGITYDIWEGGGMDLILDYYDSDVEVYSLEGVTCGAEAVVQTSKAVLAAFPDRRLFGEAVIWSEEEGGALLSSHRILSPMTNTGESRFGPATGKRIEMMIIADCLVREGKIVQEWLVRDNLAMVNQLGIDAVKEAARHHGQSRDARSSEWRASELARLESSTGIQVEGSSDAESIAAHLLAGLWQSDEAGLEAFIKKNYAPYAVMHRSPIEYYSGRCAVFAHYAEANRAFRDRQVSLDHVAARPFDDQGMALSARWAIRCVHSAPYLGEEATGRTLFILGISHWQLLGARVLREWTVFDGLAVLAQMIDS